MTVIKYHEGGFPPDKLDWDRLVPHIGPANAAVARYDGILSAVPNAAVLLSPLTTQEAVLSSRIEGTQATMGEVLEFEAEKLPDAMGAWEKYLHATAPDRLVQLAVIHAEFEAMHPFLDGNGRLGRMLVPLFLYQTNLISSPMFYISAYLEANRDEYYDRLMYVSGENDWTGWCIFFLGAICAQAKDNQQKAKSMLDLYEEMKTTFVDLTHSQYAIRALDWMFERPIFKSSDFVRFSGIPKATVFRMLNLLKKQAILNEIRPGRGRTAAILVFSRLLNIAEGHDVF